MTLIDISNDMTDEFFKDAVKGKVLGFKLEDTTTYYKIKRLDKHRKIVKVEEVRLYTGDELKEELAK